MSLLSEKLAPIWSEISKLKARQHSIFPATVTSINPVRIRIDGESQSLAASPDVAEPVGPGDRVRVLRHGTTHLVIARMNVGRTPYAMAAGNAGVPGAGANVATVDITFPANRFHSASVPIVTLSVRQTPWYYAYANNVSASGFTIGVRRYDGNDFDFTNTVMWQAVQMTPTAATG